MSTSAVSSVSGYCSFANSKGKPPGSMPRVVIAQSPRLVISVLSNHFPARSKAGSFAGTPASLRPVIANAVSQTGDRQGWTVNVSFVSSAKLVSRPSNPFAITGWSNL